MRVGSRWGILGKGNGGDSPKGQNKNNETKKKTILELTAENAIIPKKENKTGKAS